MTMFYYLFHICLLINFVLNQQVNNNKQCLLLNEKLLKYNVNINLVQNDKSGIRLCQNTIENVCCPQIYENRIQNATAIELYHLFELYTISLYEPLVRLTNDYNNTFIKLIELSRNETHSVLQRGYNKLYQSYRLSIDYFFNNLLTLTYRTYEHDIKTYVDQLFRHILHISLTLNMDKSISQTYFSCLWKSHPFGNNPNLLVSQLEINLGKLLQLNELLKLSNELVQLLSMSVTTDYHCIDSYLQLSYCNLCGGRDELPCLSNCINVIESCLANITLIDDVWTNFIDALDHTEYFNNIDKVLSSIGLSISDAVMTFFNSGGVENKDVIDQCGYLRSRRETYFSNEKLDDQSVLISTTSLSSLDKQLIFIKQELQRHKLFWINLPDQICRSKGVTASHGTTCWTGSSLSQDGTHVRTIYDKPLSLKLQWILKEMKQKSQTIGNNKRRPTSELNQILITNSSLNKQFSINQVIENLTNTFKSNDTDDYPNENDFDYSDYAYEDATDEIITTTKTTTASTTTIKTTTTTTITTTTSQDELDDTYTAYYDYGDQDLYSDDELEHISTSEEPIITTTTRKPVTTTYWRDRIPYYHRRPSIIWNVNKDNDEHTSYRYNSGSSFHYSLLLILIVLIYRV